MKAVKDFIRAELRRRGWELTRIQAKNGNQIGLVAALIERAVLLNKQSAILQIGANDAVLTDPVYALIRKYDLPALLVEPLPDVFERLRKNVGGNPKVQLANVAIARSSGTASIYRINPDTPGMPAWIAGTATFDRNLLLYHKRAPGVPAHIYEQSIQEISVPVLTIGELLARHDSMPVSIVCIDTEGYDFEVIKSVLDVGLRPDLISYEHKHLSLDDQGECRTLLSGLGYCFFSDEHDTVASRH
jgi:FkbM family methyltransferase